jgi:hypothetical protein
MIRPKLKSLTKTSYVVAISQKEADEIARDRPDLIHREKLDAYKHLSRVTGAPTDPYYAAQYRVYTVGEKGRKAK